MERRFMYGRFLRVAAGTVTASLLAAGGGGAQTALAGSRSVVQVPCSAAALTTAVSSASSGETLSLATLCTYGLTSALPPIVEKLTIKGNRATIEGQSAGAPDFAILTVGGRSGTDIGTLAVSGLNISSGAPGINLLNGTVSVNGGRFSGNATAIESNFYTTLHVSGATFTGNSGKYGGAIFGTASVSVTDSTFTGNSAERGGAVYLQYGKQEITHCQFSGNTATYAGGGLYDDSNITMTGTTFSSNHAEVGGAVSVFDLSSAALAVSGSAFVANTARIGGAIYNYDGLTATDSVFTANHASQGGAVDQDWYATLTGDLFTRNTATASGGGMYAGYTTTVSQSTFARNTAGSHGGGIDNGLGSLNLAGPLVVSGSSVTGNVAGTDGGGIFNDSTHRATAGLAGTTTVGNLPDNCAPPSAVSGCAAMATAIGGAGLAWGGDRPAPGRSVPWRSVPRHHGGHLPRLLLRELSGR
jgi:predicted outer membrane repeat protein